MRRLLRLIAFSAAAYLLGIPLLLVVAAALLALGFAAGAGLGGGVFSLIGWAVLGSPDAGRAALVCFVLGGVAFAAMTALFDVAATLFVRWRAARRPPPLRIELRRPAP